jgi:hypothetical protein
MRTVIPLHVRESFEPEVLDAMGAAFEEAWSSLCSSGERLSAQEICDARIHLARVILDLTTLGVREPAELRDRALASVMSSAGAQ